MRKLSLITVVARVKKSTSGKTPYLVAKFQSELNVDYHAPVNTLRTGDADLRFYITTVQDG